MSSRFSSFHTMDKSSRVCFSSVFFCSPRDMLNDDVVEVGLKDLRNP